MSVIAISQDVEASSLATVIDYVAQKSNLCVKVLDRDGRCVAVNRRGLELLQAQADDVCGRIWADFWDGDTAPRARAAVSAAFAGQNDRFTARYHGLPTETLWEIETCPLDNDADGVRSVLVISTDITTKLTRTAAQIEDRREITDRLGEVLHTFSNVASAAASSTRLLRRTEDPELVLMVAAHLEEAAHRAEDALTAMRTALQALRRD